MSPSRQRDIKSTARILQVVILLVWLVMFGRLIQLQIIDYEKYAPMSRENFVRQDFVNPARGLILDRNGINIVENEPIYSITVNPVNFNMANVPLLADLLHTNEEDVLRRIRDAQQYSWFRTSRLYTEVSFDVFSNIQENIWQLPGIGHQIESKRHYPLPLSASHTLGYLREASREEYLSSDRIRLGDKIGKSGIEMVYEEYLRGELGAEYNRVNAFGQTLGHYNNKEFNVTPVKGLDIITTLDADLQILSEKLMEGKKGGIVAMDPNTGEILSMVSAPQYDLSRLAGRLDSEYWRSINMNEETPLFNRAISSRQPPGSTFKPFMGLIGLHLGLITKDTKIYNSGAYFRGRAYRDLAEPGEYDLKEAIGKSSNTFFFWMMDQIASRRYFNQWSRLTKDFGMGRRNYIDLPFETAGIIPDSTYMNTNFGERRWGIGDLMSLGVGQGMVSVSPLQMAVATSVIANGGYRVQPHTVRGIIEADGTISYTEPNRERLDWIRNDHLELVQQGMRGVVISGSGRWYSDLGDIAVAGKTGTSQNPHGRNHGWYIAYAPFDDPQIAVAVLVENAGFGSISATPIASLVIEQYLRGEIERQHVYNYVLNFRPREDPPAEIETGESDVDEVLPETEGQP
jgi:penicillin-binding protein 2